MGRIDAYPDYDRFGAAGSTLGYAQVTANQLNTTALTDLTGLSVNVTVPAGRRLKITGKTLAQSSVATDRIRLYIRDGADNSLAQSTVVPSIAGLSIDLGVSVVLSPSAGMQTYKLSMERAGGSGTIDLIANAFAPSYILVEDITGTLWPGSMVTPGMISPGAIPGLGTGGSTIAALFTNPINTWSDWGSALVIPNPGRSVSITVQVTGQFRNFTTMSYGIDRIAISFDGGSSFTTGQEAGFVCGQTAPTANRTNVTGSFFRSGLPTGDIHLKAQGRSDHASSAFEFGTLTYTVVPI